MILLTPHRVASLTLRAILAIAVVLPCLMATGPARAKTPLEQEWSRYNGWQLDWFRLEGAPAELGSQLKDGLALAGEGRFLRGRAMPRFRTRLLREDLARTRLFLARSGFPAAEVTPVAFPRPGGNELGVTLRIDPGPMVRVVTTELVGWPPGLAPPDSSNSNLLRSGERFADGKLDRSRDFLTRFLKDAGFALAAVEASVRPVGPEAVSVIFTVAAGDRYDITSVAVNGCSPDLEGLARRLIDIDPPAPYSQTRLDEAAFDLRSTQLFRQVALDATRQGPGDLLLAANLDNARMRSLEISVGTWSDNPWMVRTGWSHRNLLKGGRGLDTQASLATHTQSVGGGVTWFGWLSPRARTRAGAGWVREDEETYLSKEWRLDLTQTMRPRRTDLAHVGLSVSKVSVIPYSTDDQLIVDRNGHLLEVWADRKWDWTDDPLYPAKGGFGKLTGTWSPPIGFSESPYVSVQGDLSLYRGLGGGAVLVGHTRMGWARPLGGTEALIPNRRFYAGGYSTMRGYGRRQLGPRDDEGVPRGGGAVLLAATELRLPMFWILDLAVFVDSGQVWWKPGDMRLADMETAVGLDLDVRTPLGPVRFGYAWNLGRVDPGEPDALAHFGVGYPW